MAATAAAEAPPGEATSADDGIEGWHIVRPGESLEALSERYTGDRAAWPRQWALNPTIDNPHLLYPGQRIRVLMDPLRTRPAARVEQIARRVESKPEPTPWETAMPGELLLARDGVRTYPQASAGLRFTDGTWLALGESSLVFLRNLEQAASSQPVNDGAATSTAAARRPRIEIREGSADVTGATRASRAAVEIVVAEARATAEAADGPLVGRARSAPERAQFMLYGGRAEVEANNQRVALTQGTGTSVPAGRAPEPPETLLAAPTDLAPAAGATRSSQDLELSWAAIAGAAAYGIEICSDNECGAVLARGRTSATTWRPDEPLAEGTYQWRVRAISTSDLDGFPSPVRTVVVGAGGEVAPPQISVVLPATPWRVNGLACFDARELAIEVRVTDAGCGIAETVLELDGQLIAPTALERGQIPGGVHTLVVAATDRCGNRSSAAPVSFVADADEPVFLAETAAPAPLELGMMPDPARDVLRRRAKWRERGYRWLEWSRIGHLWAPLPTGADPAPVREYLAKALANAPTARQDGGVIASWPLEPERPWVFFAAPGGSPFAAGGPALEAGQTLWVVARDPGCGIADFELRSLAATTTTTSPASTPAGPLPARVELRATDRFGRTRVLSWPLADTTSRH